jgi:uncharacterized membrane protein YhaH (DUF805 family)
MTLPPAPAPSTAIEPPLWAPYYGASFGAAFTRFWKKYATFNGRASRSEFWWWQLCYFIAALVFEVVFFVVAIPAASVSNNGSIAFSPAYFVVIGLLWILSLATIIPTLAIAWRRLHDTNRSGGYYFIGFIPFVGGIILLVFLASASHPAGARFDRPTP